MLEAVILGEKIVTKHACHVILNAFLEAELSSTSRIVTIIPRQV